MLTADAHLVSVFRCLGPVILTAGGLAVSLRTRKQLGLLLYLARRPGRPVGRDELIDLFWSEDAEKAGRHSLSQSVSLINKRLGSEAIAATGRDRLVVRAGTVALDVNDFERLAAEGRHEEAIELWRGSLLEGIWVPRAPQFERWLGEERSRLQRTFRRMAHGRIEAFRASGDHAALREEAERLLQLDPLDENAMLAHLEALALLGDRTLALRRYAEFEERLRSELAAEPGSALRAWSRRSRKGDDDATLLYRLASPRISEVTVLPASQPLYGRKEEFAVLWDGWERAATGVGSFYLIEGEAGIGKTALVTKLVNQAHVAGGSVCFVRCYRTEKSVPFAPITSLIRQLCRLPGFVALDPVWIGELTRLVPELRERYPAVPTPMAVDDAARHRLSDATVQAALAVADEQPLMIVIDDLHDADEASLATVHFLLRQMKGQPIHMTGVSKSEAQLPDAQRAFFESARFLSANVLVLGPLPSDQTARLAEQVLASRGIPAGSTDIEEIVRLSGGNPLRAIEAAATQGMQLAKDPMPAPRSSFDISAQTRIAALDQQAFMTAGAVSVAGRPLGEYELQVVTGLTSKQLATSISTLQEGQLVRRHGSTIALAHDMYAETVIARMDDQTRAAVHKNLADLLRSAEPRNPATKYEVALHYAAAGNAPLARKMATEATRYAVSVGALREQAAALRLTLDLSGGSDAGIASELGGCLLELGELDALGELLESNAVLPATGDSRAADFLYLDLARRHQLGIETSWTTKRGLVNLLQARRDFRHIAAARTLLMRVAYRASDYDLMRKVARESRRRFRSERETYGHALLALAYVAAKYYRPKRALLLLRQALVLALRDNDLSLETLCRTGLGIVSRQLGLFRAAADELELAVGLAKRRLNPRLEAQTLVDLASAEMTLGATDRALWHMDCARDLQERYPDPSGGALRQGNLGEMLLQLGDVAQARPNFEMAGIVAERLGYASTSAMATAGLALCAQREGNYEEVRRHCIVLERAGPARETHDRWMIEAALAWNTAVNGDGQSAAAAQLSSALVELQKRDADHWLALRLEALRLHESVEGEIDQRGRAELASAATLHDAGGILNGLSRLPNRA